MKKKFNQDFNKVTGQEIEKGRKKSARRGLRTGIMNGEGKGLSKDLRMSKQR